MPQFIYILPRWTQWFNTDDQGGEGDFECVECIRERGFQVCDGSSVVKAECRIANARQVFTQRTASQIYDALSNPCTKRGLVCLNADQRDGHACADYEVRFKCAASDNDLKTMYWWIGILAAVVFVVTVLWCIFYFVRKRRESHESPTVTEAEDPSLSQPPPSYKDLFGSEWGNNVTAPDYASSLDPLVSSSACADDERGILSPAFSMNDELNRERSLLNVETNYDNVPARGRTVSPDDVNLPDRVARATNDIVETNNTDTGISRNDSNANSNVQITLELPHRDEAHPVNAASASGSPAPPFLPWMRRTSTHRSPFPLLQPHPTPVDPPPTYREALTYPGVANVV